MSVEPQNTAPEDQTNAAWDEDRVRARARQGRLLLRVLIMVLMGALLLPLVLFFRARLGDHSPIPPVAAGTAFGALICIWVAVAFAIAARNPSKAAPERSLLDLVITGIGALVFAWTAAWVFDKSTAETVSGVPPTNALLVAAAALYIVDGVLMMARARKLRAEPDRRAATRLNALYTEILSADLWTLRILGLGVVPLLFVAISKRTAFDDMNLALLFFGACGVLVAVSDGAAHRSMQRALRRAPFYVVLAQLVFATAMTRI